MLWSLSLFCIITYFAVQRSMLPAYINTEQGHVLDIAAPQLYLTIPGKTRESRIILSVVSPSPYASKGQFANQLDLEEKLKEEVFP